jgi:hypothetical protein
LAFLQKKKFDSHAQQQQHTNMQMSEKCLLVHSRKAATTGFTHAAILPGPSVRITISTGLLLTAAVSSCAPLFQLDELMTAPSSSATLPSLVHLLLQPLAYKLRSRSNVQSNFILGCHACTILDTKEQSHKCQITSI